MTTIRVTVRLGQTYHVLRTRYEALQQNLPVVQRTHPPFLEEMRGRQRDDQAFDSYAGCMFAVREGSNQLRRDDDLVKGRCRADEGNQEDRGRNQLIYASSPAPSVLLCYSRYRACEQARYRVSVSVLFLKNDQVKQGEPWNLKLTTHRINLDEH